MKKPTTNKTTKTTTTTNNKKVNETVNDKMLTMNEFIDVLHKNGISIASTKNNSSFYRILRGGSSIHIKKTSYLMYTTNDDYALLETAKLDGVTLENGTNSTDKVRPNIVRIDKNSIVNVLKVIAKNVNNQFA